METESEESEEIDLLCCRSGESIVSRLGRLRSRDGSRLSSGLLNDFLNRCQTHRWLENRYLVTHFASVFAVGLVSGGGRVADSLGASLGLLNCWLRDGREMYGLSC